MSPLIATLTLIFLPLPLLLVVVGLSTQSAAIHAGLFTGAIWAFIWFYWRPTEFEISDRGLRIVWPIRERLIPAFDILSAEQISVRGLKDQFGRLMRFGAGGLWGGFGMALTQRGPNLALYASRTSDFVLVRCRDHRPLLLTPHNPERFVQALAELAR